MLLLLFIFLLEGALEASPIATSVSADLRIAPRIVLAASLALPPRPRPRLPDPPELPSVAIGRADDISRAKLG